MLNSDYEEKLTRKNYYLYLRENNVLAKYAHFHSNLEIIYLISGSVSAVINGKESRYNKDDLIIVNPFEMHFYKNATKDMNAMVLVIGHEYLNSFNYFYNGKIFDTIKKNIIPIKKRREILNIIHEWFKLGSENLLINSIYVNKILYNLTEIYPLIENTSRKINIQEALMYISEHYKEDLTMEQVAEKFGYTKEYFSTEFNKYVGINFRGYINRLRVLKAKELIKNNVSITQAIREVGFENNVTYYRAKAKYFE